MSIQLQVHSNFDYSPSFSYQKKRLQKKGDSIGDTFKNTDPVLRQNNSNKDDYDGDDDDPWVLTDGKYWFYILFFS